MKKKLRVEVWNDGLTVCVRRGRNIDDNLKLWNKVNCNQIDSITGLSWKQLRDLGEGMHDIA